MAPACYIPFHYVLKLTVCSQRGQVSHSCGAHALKSDLDEIKQSHTK